MEIRELKAGDLYTVGAMLKKVVPQMQKQNLNRLPNEEESAFKARVGQSIFQLLLDNCYDDAWKWLASMLNMSVEEFNNQPLKTPIELIEAISKDESLPDFLKRLSNILKLK